MGLAVGVVPAVDCAPIIVKVTDGVPGSPLVAVTFLAPGDDLSVSTVLAVPVGNSAVVELNEDRRCRGVYCSSRPPSRTARGRARTQRIKLGQDVERVGETFIHPEHVGTKRYARRLRILERPILEKPLGNPNNDNFVSGAHRIIRYVRSIVHIQGQDEGSEIVQRVERAESSSFTVRSRIPGGTHPNADTRPRRASGTASAIASTISSRTGSFVLSA